MWVRPLWFSALQLSCMVLFIYYWNKPSIKATSPYLSVLILAGCYMLYTGTLFSSMREIVDPKLFGPMCQAEVWFTATGMQLIFSWDCFESIFDVGRYVGWGCILNCFMLSSLPCFYAFCWSAIPTFLMFFFIYFCIIEQQKGYRVKSSTTSLYPLPRTNFNYTARAHNLCTSARQRCACVFLIISL